MENQMGKHMDNNVESRGCKDMCIGGLGSTLEMLVWNGTRNGREMEGSIWGLGFRVQD